MATKVSDRFVELAAGVTLILVGVIGYLVDDKLESINGAIISQYKEQIKTNKELGKVNGFIQIFSNEISALKTTDLTLKSADKEINVKVDGINERVYILEGKR